MPRDAAVTSTLKLPPSAGGVSGDCSRPAGVLHTWEHAFGKIGWRHRQTHPIGAVAMLDRRASRHALHDAANQRVAGSEAA